MRMARPEGLLAILVIALVARLVFCFGVAGIHSELRGDQLNYQNIARRLVQGSGFAMEDGTPSAARPPLYPMFLAGVYQVFGIRPEAGKITQVLLGVVMVLLVYAIAKRLFSDTVAMLAALLAAINPSMIFISGYLLSENLYSLFLLAFILLLVGQQKSAHPSYARVVLGGFLLGQAGLTRPCGLVFATGAAVVLILLAPVNLKRLTRAGVLLLVLVLTIFPWTLRNYLRLGAWVPLSTNGGLTFYMSNCERVFDLPRYRGTIVPLDEVGQAEIKKAGNEIECDRLGWRMGMTFLKENWRRIPTLVSWKFLRFWRIRSGVTGPWWWDSSSTLGALANRIDHGLGFNVIVVPLFLIGLAITSKRYKDMALLYTLILAHVAVALVFFGSLRARVPVEPAISIFASAALVKIVGQLRRGSATRFLDRFDFHLC